MKKSGCVVLALLMIISLVGCNAAPAPSDQPDPVAEAGANEATAAPAPAEQAVPQKIAVITGTGGLGDQSLNDYCYEGAAKLKDEGVQVDVVEPKDASDIEELQRIYAETGEYALIVCIGFDSSNALKIVSAEFPDQMFAITDDEVDAPNVASLNFKGEETGFLLGVLSGLLVKGDELPNTRGKNMVGFIAGLDFYVPNTFAAGFEAGARLVNFDAAVQNAYVGSYSDPSTAAEQATGMYQQGADIIFACAGGSGLGIFNAAADCNGYALGLEGNQNALAPDYIIASGIRDWTSFVYDACKLALKGELDGGILVYGIAQGALYNAHEGSNVAVSDEIQAEVDRYSALVADGTLVIPKTLDEVEPFIAANGSAYGIGY